MQTPTTTKANRKPVTIHLTASEVDSIDALIGSLGRSRKAVVENLVRTGLEKLESSL